MKATKSPSNSIHHIQRTMTNDKKYVKFHIILTGCFHSLTYENNKLEKQEKKLSESNKYAHTHTHMKLSEEVCNRLDRRSSAHNIRGDHITGRKEWRKGDDKANNKRRDRARTNESILYLLTNREKGKAVLVFVWAPTNAKNIIILLLLLLFVVVVGVVVAAAVIVRWFAGNFSALLSSFLLFYKWFCVRLQIFRSRVLETLWSAQRISHDCLMCNFLFLSVVGKAMSAFLSAHIGRFSLRSPSTKQSHSLPLLACWLFSVPYYIISRSYEG